MIREQLEAHAVACREALLAGCVRPWWEGGSLAGLDLSHANLAEVQLADADLRRATLTGVNFTGATLAGVNLDGAALTGATLIGADLRAADLRRADLSGADLCGAYLTLTWLDGADLSGARLDEGTVIGRAIGGRAGGFRWWAVALKDGGAILQYGWERYPLIWWLAQGPEFGETRGRPPGHWEEGPAVAIAAARKLVAGLSAVPAIPERNASFDCPSGSAGPLLSKEPEGAADRHRR